MTKPKYYHSNIPTEKILEEMLPNGYYEKVSERTGCPEHLFSDPLASFPISNIGEICFTKSPEAAILAGANTQCATEEERHPISKQHLKIIQELRQQKLCMLDIYETEEEPDIDISECPNDFSIIEEVRYRKPVRVRKSFTVELSPKLVSQIFEEGYGQKELTEAQKKSLELFSEVYGTEQTEPMVDEEVLVCIKQHIADSLRAGKSYIDPISPFFLCLIFRLPSNPKKGGTSPKNPKKAGREASLLLIISNYFFYLLKFLFRFFLIGILKNLSLNNL